MRLLIDDLNFEVPPHATFGMLLEAMAGVHPDVPAEIGPRTSVVLCFDERRWAQLEAGRERKIMDFLPKKIKDPVRLRLAVADRCPHGSPAVPGQGYACGLC